MITMILSNGDIHLLNSQGKIEKPTAKASFYFNYGTGWIPLQLTKALLLSDKNAYIEKPFYLLYFSSKYLLPSEIQEKNHILSSPLGLLSIDLYLNQKFPIIRCKNLNKTSCLIKLTNFPGTEGSYCGGNILIPSKFPGYCLSLELPKL